MKIVPVDEIPSPEKVRKVFCFKEEYIALYKEFLDMKELCIRLGGIGLSAVQIGKPKAMFVASISGKWRYFLNCEYQGQGQKQSSIEGCLSLRTPAGTLRRFEVKRWEEVKINGQELIDSPDLTVIKIEKVFSGLNGVLMQHEIDHQLGVLISDIGEEIDPKLIKKMGD
jgi:peptide deformylase